MHGDDEWRPAARLRRLQGVALRSFAPSAPVRRCDHFYFELYDGGGGGGGSDSAPAWGLLPLYVSERVPLDFDLLWDGLALAAADDNSDDDDDEGGGGGGDADDQGTGGAAGGTLAARLNAPREGELVMVIRVVRGGSGSGGAYADVAAAAGHQHHRHHQCDPTYASPPGNRCPWGAGGVGDSDDGAGTSSSADQQEQEQQQQQEGQNSINTNLQQQQQQQQPEEEGQTRRFDSAAKTSSSNNKGASNDNGGEVLMTLRFSLSHLRRLSVAEAAPGEGRGLNRLVLELPDGCYGPLPPQPPPSAQAASCDDGDEDAGGFVRVARAPSLARAGSSAARQQQFFRWILSNSTSVLDGIEHAPSSGARASYDGGGGGGSAGAALAAAAAASAAVAAHAAEERRNAVGFRSGNSSSGGGAVGAATSATPPSAFAALAAAAAAATASAPAGGAGVRSYDAREFAARTRRLIALCGDLREARASAAAARRRVGALVAPTAPRSAAHLQQLELARARAAVGEARARVDAAQRELDAQVERAIALRHNLLAKCASLEAAADALAGARLRVDDARAHLAGPEGYGRWRSVHAALAARRNRLVSEVGAAFQIGPAPASALRPSLLAAKLDDSWWAPDDGGDADVSNGGGSGGGARVSASGGAGGGANGGANNSAAAAAAARARLQICGLELRPDLARRVLQGAIGWGEADEEERVAAALGAAAAATRWLAAYLGVPLRYPLDARASLSSVCDPAPPARGGAGEHSGGAAGGGGGSPVAWGLDALRGVLPGALGGGGFAGGGAAAAAAPHSHSHPGGGGDGHPSEHAAECHGERLALRYDAADRAALARALLLLNKDVEQLLTAHGLTGAAPGDLLGNLHALVLAAQSALPPPPPPPPPMPAMVPPLPSPLQQQQQQQSSPQGAAAAAPTPPKDGVAAAARAAEASAAAAAAAAVAAARAAEAAAAKLEVARSKLPAPLAFDWGDVDLGDGSASASAGNGAADGHPR